MPSRSTRPAYGTQSKSVTSSLAMVYLTGAATGRRMVSRQRIVHRHRIADGTTCQRYTCRRKTHRR